MHLATGRARARPAAVDTAGLDEQPALGGRDEVFPVLHRSPDRVVLGLVGPFHRRIVPGLLDRPARQGWTSGG